MHYFSPFFGKELFTKIKWRNCASRWLLL